MVSIAASKFRAKKFRAKQGVKLTQLFSSPNFREKKSTKSLENLIAFFV